MYGTYMQYIYICIDKCAPVQIHVLAQKYMLPLDFVAWEDLPEGPFGQIFTFSNPGSTKEHCQNFDHDFPINSHCHVRKKWIPAWQFPHIIPGLMSIRPGYCRLTQEGRRLSGNGKYGVPTGGPRSVFPGVLDNVIKPIINHPKGCTPPIYIMSTSDKWLPWFVN